jgi:hypothetical protein
MPNIIKVHRLQSILSLAIMIIAVLFSFSQLRYIKYLMKWHEANTLYYKENYHQSATIYLKIFNRMNKDPLFLQFYGKSLQMAGEYRKCKMSFRIF